MPPCALLCFSLLRCIAVACLLQLRDKGGPSGPAFVSQLALVPCSRRATDHDAAGVPQAISPTHRKQPTAVGSQAQCFRGAGIYPTVPEDVQLFAEDPSACAINAPPTYVDFRCQGYAGDRCGCLSIPSVSQTPYFGCVLSGYTAPAASEIPLVTLPGVVTQEVLDSVSAPCVDTARALGAAQPCAPPQLSLLTFVALHAVA